jgi:hypothetical protein
MRFSWPDLDEARAPRENGRSRGGGESEPVREALDHLDHLLEPLAVVSEQEFDFRSQPVRQGAVAGATDDGLAGAIVRFRRRVRWSRRFRYRIPRLVITWLSVGLVLIGLTWVMLTLTGSR